MSFGPFPNDPGLDTGVVAKAFLNNAVQNIAAAPTAFYKVLLDTKDANDNSQGGMGRWDFTNNQWICSQPGWYYVAGAIEAIPASAGSIFWAGILVNGLPIINGSIYYGTPANDAQFCEAVGHCYLNAGDLLTLALACSGTPASGMTINNLEYTFMSLAKA